ncbi:uncharacterized protein KY384_006783 [Bacidia gigantensis]|uniref:uncharacterized protein n=1 Tax=Bacidia gigantensis TaxID=2732470 RepID=UPI001D042E86|nr:uncharacterized protein KY384_006783 [Bacidia gigantensis]KAG8527867.1 hypothetical protein KY384_006783 [Bacidia gigantensis]
MGIIQARKWWVQSVEMSNVSRSSLLREIGTLNDFRDFFGMSRHETFENISKNVEIQDALRDLYEHPDKVELYPGVFCESSVEEDLDPGPSDVDSALWVAIFSDAITLVRSDRFYTVDWNTNSLTSWGMKEVSPDNDTLKSSVFHRLMQRAFPEWFPYDSIRFFHPFYTAKKNAEYAQQQGYAPEFKMEANVIQRDSFSRPTKFEYITAASEPRKPLKPLYLDDYEKIDALLSDQSDKIVHPARLELSSLPTEVAAVLKPEQKKAGPGAVKDIKVNSSKIMAYFESIMIDMIKREFITVNKAKPTYQLDVTRDFAIPVTTRYVAEFLGFSHLIRSESNLKAPYSENEIYRHITNCQIFLSYNADETKLLKRRKAFKTSIKFLYELSKGGTIHEARRWSYTRGTLHAIRRFFGYGKADTMESLGLQVAIQILGQEKDFGKAAAILLLTALDGAYNSVLAFTSVLDLFLGELYKVEGTTNKCRWQKIQKLAFQDDEKSQEITEYVLEAQKESVKLPIIRKAVEDCKIKKGTTTLISVKKGQTIICNIHKAMAPHNPSTASQTLNYSASNFGANLPSGYNPKDIAVLSLTAMIKTLAQLKDLRRGHDAQGQLKKITIDGSNEGYANFMAPGRLQQIRHDAKEKQDSRVFNEGVLKPSTESYLSPEWDEMVPFPTTWKVRFSGFGPSDYGGPKLPLLKKAPLPDDYPPFYQPQGASHTGGSFADTVCVCNVPGRMCGCKDGEGNGEVVKTEADKLGKGASGCGALG